MSSNVEILLKAVDNASKALNDIEKELKDIDGAGTKTQKATDNFGESLDGLKLNALAAAGAVMGVVKATEKIYELGKAGAEIEWTAEKFNRLAQTIGTTGEALSTDLDSATQGLMSNAQMIASATDVISLGLVKNQEDAVRLVTVMTNLGMDMNQVVLALSNQTTMRFDQLGVSVAGFDDRLQGLKDSGMDVNDAFTEAFLQQAEEQLAKVGSVAESDKGKIMQLEASVNDLWDAFKTALAPAVAQVAKGLTAEINATVAMNDAIKQGIITQDEATAMMYALRGGYIDYATILEYVTAKTDAYNERVEYLQSAMGPLAPMFKEAGEAAEESANQFKASAEQIAAAEMDAGELESLTKDVRDRANEAALGYQAMAQELRNISKIDFAQFQIEQLQGLLEVEIDPEKRKALEEEIRAIAIAAKLASDASYALSDGVNWVNQMVANGILPAADYAEALSAAKLAATDGVLTYGELVEALEAAGITFVTTADILNEQDLDPIITATGELFGNLSGIAAADTKKTFTYTINVKTTGPVGLLGQGGFGRSDTIEFTEGGEPTYEHATGGSWIIPPGYPDDNYPLGGGHYGNTGEKVTVTPVGQSAPDNGNAALLASILAELRNFPRANALALEQALQRLST